MDTGLIFDAGQYTVNELNLRIWEYAQSHGFVAENVKDTCENCVMEISDEAIDWLNDALYANSERGMWYGFGDNAEGFGLWNIEDEETLD